MINAIRIKLCFTLLIISLVPIDGAALNRNRIALDDNSDVNKPANLSSLTSSSKVVPEATFPNLEIITENVTNKPSYGGIITEDDLDCDEEEEEEIKTQDVTNAPLSLSSQIITEAELDCDPDDEEEKNQNNGTNDIGPLTYPVPYGHSNKVVPEATFSNLEIITENVTNKPSYGGIITEDDLDCDEEEEVEIKTQDVTNAPLSSQIITEEELDCDPDDAEEENQNKKDSEPNDIGTFTYPVPYGNTGSIKDSEISNRIPLPVANDAITEQNLAYNENEEKAEAEKMEPAQNQKETISQTNHTGDALYFPSLENKDNEENTDEGEENVNFEENNSGLLTAFESTSNIFTPEKEEKPITSSQTLNGVSVSDESSDTTVPISCDKLIEAGLGCTQTEDEETSETETISENNDGEEEEEEIESTQNKNDLVSILISKILNKSQSDNSPDTSASSSSENITQTISYSVRDEDTTQEEEDIENTENSKDEEVYSGHLSISKTIDDTPISEEQDEETVKFSETINELSATDDLLDTSVPRSCENLTEDGVGCKETKDEETAEILTTQENEEDRDQETIDNQRMTLTETVSYDEDGNERLTFSEFIEDQMPEGENIDGQTVSQVPEGENIDKEAVSGFSPISEFTGDTSISEKEVSTPNISETINILLENENLPDTSVPPSCENLTEDGIGCKETKDEETAEILTTQENEEDRDQENINNQKMTLTETVSYSEDGNERLTFSEFLEDQMPEGENIDGQTVSQVPEGENMDKEAVSGFSPISEFTGDTSISEKEVSTPNISETINRLSENENLPDTSVPPSCENLTEDGIGCKQTKDEETAEILTTQENEEDRDQENIDNQKMTLTETVSYDEDGNERLTFSEFLEDQMPEGENIDGQTVSQVPEGENMDKEAVSGFSPIPEFTGDTSISEKEVSTPNISETLTTFSEAENFLDTSVPPSCENLTEDGVGCKETKDEETAEILTTQENEEDRDQENIDNQKITLTETVSYDEDGNERLTFSEFIEDQMPEGENIDGQTVSQVPEGENMDKEAVSGFSPISEFTGDTSISEKEVSTPNISETINRLSENENLPDTSVPPSCENLTEDGIACKETKDEETAEILTTQENEEDKDQENIDNQKMTLTETVSYDEDGNERLTFSEFIEDQNPKKENIDGQTISQVPEGENIDKEAISGFSPMSEITGDTSISEKEVETPNISETITTFSETENFLDISVPPSFEKFSENIAISQKPVEFPTLFAENNIDENTYEKTTSDSISVNNLNPIPSAASSIMSLISPPSVAF